MAANNAQGAGFGRRGDLTDGHSWAGGLGVLADLQGDDHYQAGNFAQGLGYWFGTGLLLDAAGDDLYQTVYFSQGAGAHYGLGLLYDAAGNDRHLLQREAGASLGYGWDFALGLLVDSGGDDLYRARTTSLGAAHRSSLGLFLELAGDDRYEVPAQLPGLGCIGLGYAGENPAGHDPGGPLRAAAEAAQIGLFLDLGGHDRYGRPGETGTGQAEPEVRYGNDRHWTWPVDPTRTLGRYLGTGLDLQQPTPPAPVLWLLTAFDVLPLECQTGFSPRVEDSEVTGIPNP